MGGRAGGPARGHTARLGRRHSRGRLCPSVPPCPSGPAPGPRAQVVQVGRPRVAHEPRPPAGAFLLPRGGREPGRELLEVQPGRSCPPRAALAAMRGLPTGPARATPHKSPRAARGGREPVGAMSARRVRPALPWASYGAAVYTLAAALGARVRLAFALPLPWGQLGPRLGRPRIRATGLTNHRTREHEAAAGREPPARSHACHYISRVAGMCGPYFGDLARYRRGLLWQAGPLSESRPTALAGLVRLSGWSNTKGRDP